MPIDLNHAGPLLEDVRDAAERLDVVDDRRLGERAGDGRERRLVPRPAALAFERFEQARLFAADVRAGAAVDVALELVLAEPKMPFCPKTPLSYASLIACSSTFAWR